MQETVNSGRAAKMIGIPASTLRLWSKTYAEFLAPGAQPGPGEERRYTAADLDVLRAVNQLRHNGMLPADIALRLRITAATGQQPAIDGPGNVADVPHVQTAIAPAADVLQTFLGQRDQLASIDRRLERVEHQRNLVLVALAGVAVGALVVGIIAVLVR